VVTQPAPPPPEDLEQQAAATRNAAELAAIALFVAAASESDAPSPADIAVIRGIFAKLVKGIAGAALATAGPPPGRRPGELLSLSTEIDDLATRLSAAGSREIQDLIGMVRRIRQSNRDAPPRDPGELSLAREAARNFATWAYGKAIEAVAPVLPKPAWLAVNLGLKKTWISQSDSRVRPLHRRLHGRTRGWEQDFWRWPVTGQKLRYPGDPEAPLDAVIGCRCLCWLSWSRSSDLSQVIRPLPGVERPTSPH
jgi:hypothetical protein